MTQGRRNVPIMENDYDASDFVFAQEGRLLKDNVYISTSYLEDVWTNFRKNKGALIGMIIPIRKFRFNIKIFRRKFRACNGWDSTAFTKALMYMLKKDLRMWPSGLERIRRGGIFLPAYGRGRAFRCSLLLRPF